MSDVNEAHAENMQLMFVTCSVLNLAKLSDVNEEQVHIWRRSYDVLPPAMDRDDEHSAHTDRRYASLDDSVIPDAENLKVTLERALPFWEDKIAPALKDGKNVFVGAHGNPS